MHHRHNHDHHPRHDRDRRFARSERGQDGPGHRHGRHDAGGRSGLGRFFAHGDLRLIVLNLIAEKPRHGYEIIKAIEDQVGGAYSPSPGVIYPTLTLLEELGYVAVNAAEAGKKLHQITDQGRIFLEANRPTLDALLARMAEASHARGSTSAPQVIRAVENLKLALRLRLSNGPLTPEQIDAIAAVLDGAATSVEKI
jgi:DNA-binding PadR family transcriptional regulator